MDTFENTVHATDDPPFPEAPEAIPDKTSELSDQERTAHKVAIQSWLFTCLKREDPLFGNAEHEEWAEKFGEPFDRFFSEVLNTHPSELHAWASIAQNEFENFLENRDVHQTAEEVENARNLVLTWNAFLEKEGLHS